MTRICVFCGASAGADPLFAAVAAAFGRGLAGRSVELVTGGGKVGLMGVVADAAIEAGGRVTGVIPRRLEQREVAHRGLAELHVVETLHERKALMHELSDGFVALPGGFGTIDELAEAVTWAQLGIHEKPIGLLNPAGYFDGLIAFLDTAFSQRFLATPPAELLIVRDDVPALLDAMLEALVERGAGSPERVDPAPG